jgi:hypothetical protein
MRVTAPASAVGVDGIASRAKPVGSRLAEVVVGCR